MDMDSQQLFDAEDGDGTKETIAEAWLGILAKINENLDKERIGRFKHVKIAILDTGIDMANAIFNTPEARERIKKCENFLGDGPSRDDAHDKCGHGSHCAGLVLKVAPAADIYVARVAKDSKPGIDPQAVIKAIERAYKPKDEAGWDVDIITMSFGFLGHNEPVDQALRKALDRHKIIFAAASNSGDRRPVAFPACLGGIICVNSASGDGRASSFNPKPESPDKFAILGESVRSAWISSQPNATCHTETRSMTGSSVATPIAAALFSLLLEVAMNPREPGASPILDYYLPWMRRSDAVQILLRKASGEDRSYMVINPRELQKIQKRAGAAYWIQHALSERYGEPGDSESNQGQVLALNPPSPYPIASRPATEPPVQQAIRPPPITHNSMPVPIGAATAPRPGLFYTLTDRLDHIRPEADSYWRHLTPTAYGIYEKIYGDCKDPGSGLVDYNSFANQFTGTEPEPRIIHMIWANLLDDPGDIANSRHPKSLVLAALYMLHLRRFRPLLYPLDEKKEIGISKSRLQILKSFGNWVGCRCSAKCAVWWNFANGTGLHRRGNPTSCRLIKFINSGKAKRFTLGESEPELLKRMKLEWLERRE